MKAIILAGGYATRLRPISYAMPKLLFPIVGKPTIYWTLDLLTDFGVDEVVLGVNYLADLLKEQIGSSYEGMLITYSLENAPLGTAGPLRLAAEKTRLNETFLAMNGDVIADIDLKKMLTVHESAHALVTDALHEVKNPARFGVAELDGERRIKRFVEKPRRGQSSSRLVNAGIYIIEPEVLQMISRERKVSLEREIFPALATRRRLQGFQFEGYWFDVGNMEDYRKANFTLLQEGVRTRSPNNDRVVLESVKVVDPVYVDESATIDKGVRLGPLTVVGRNCSIKTGSRISESILFDNVYVGEKSLVSDAILASNVTLGRNVVVESGCILSPNVTVENSVRLGKGSIIHPHKEIACSLKPKAHVM